MANDILEKIKKEAKERALRVQNAKPMSQFFFGNTCTYRSGNPSPPRSGDAGGHQAG